MQQEQLDHFIWYIYTVKNTLSLSLKNLTIGFSKPRILTYKRLAVAANNFVSIYIYIYIFSMLVLKSMQRKINWSNTHTRGSKEDN